jgi:hypothetical protein
MTIRTFIGAAITAALALGGCAATRNPASASVAAARPSSCLTQTGSRIPPTGTFCASIGRSYSQQDIELTGHTNAAGALALLDPAVTR